MKTYFPTINLLRGLAAFGVCFFHFTNFSSEKGYYLTEDSFLRQIGSYGAHGVFIFFVITGFVIPMSLYKEQFKLKFFHRFFARRFLRVEIPYVASIVVIIGSNYVLSRLLSWDFTFDFQRFIYHLVYIIPWTDYEWYNIIYWTLAIEIQYYILMAVLYLLITRKEKWISILGLLLFASSGLLIKNHNLVFYYAPIFLMGITLFLVKMEKLRMAEGLVLIALFGVETAYLHSVTITIISLLTVAAIAWTNFNSNLSNYFGNISYSLYLTHGVIGGNLLYLIGSNLDSNAARVSLIIVALAVSVLGAMAFWFLIERPSQKLSKKIRINID